MFLLAQHYDADGTLVLLQASETEGEISFHRNGDLLGGLSRAAFLHVLGRYGRALDLEVAKRVDWTAATLSLGDEIVVGRLDYQAMVDVEPKAYLVWPGPAPGIEAQCALATTVGAAIEHLLRAASARSKGART